jgi:hypothetical protein
MARSFEFLPDGDIENDGWTIVGGSATTVWEVFGSHLDDCYVRVPSYRGGVEVKFPFDYSPTQFPSGAIIDSITVMIKMSTAAGSGARGVTVNVLSSDNRSRYTTRTLYASSSTKEYEVGTYAKDPLGRAWDIHRLNKLRLRVFSHNNLEDSVRVYGLWVKVNFHTKPSCVVTSPSGTVNSPSPQVTWSYIQEDGDPQKKAEYKIFPLTEASASTFSAETAEPIYSATTNGIGNSYTLPTSLNNGDYMIFARVTSNHGAQSLWASKQFTVTAPAPGVPGDNNAGLAGVPGVGTPTVIPDNYTSSAAIRMQDSSNLLSVQQADFEIPSDPLGYVAENAALDRDTTTAFAEGIASMRVTATASGTATATATKIEVHPDQPVTVRAQLKADTTGRTVNLLARFYDETYTLLGTTISATGTDSSGTWRELVASGTTPATAKYADVRIEVVGCAASEVHSVDHVGLMYGTNTAWSDGGHMSRNLLTSYMATGDDHESASDSWTPRNSATTVQRVTVSGTPTGQHGEKAHQMTSVPVSPTISYVGQGTFNAVTNGKNYTLNKPAGVIDNDLLLAFVTSSVHCSITPPPGWSTVASASIDDGVEDVALHVLKRQGLASDPSSWSTGVLSADSTRRSAVVVAYRGAAHADDQFIADATRTDASGALVHKTATVVNTDANAWRIAAFAATNNVTGGTFTANVNPPSATPPPITYVGKATTWVSTSSTNSFTVNKPSGVQSGDLMIASALFSGKMTTAPTLTGWTLVEHSIEEMDDGGVRSGSSTLFVWRRAAGSSEPNSWTAAHADFGKPRITQAVAYRNVDVSNPFIAESSAKKSNSTQVATPTVNNTDSKAWRVTIFGASTGNSASWSTVDTVERVDGSSSLTSSPDTVLSVQDSNGMVGTGNHTRTGKLSASFFTASAWIGLLRPLSTGPTPGAGESERFDTTYGSSNPWLTPAVYDSNGGVATGQQAVYGTFTASDGQANSVASWIGILKPFDTVTGGTVAAYPNRAVDLDKVDPDVFRLAGHRATVMADFRGSSSGTPTLAVEFYRGNQLIRTESAEGRAFGTDAFVKSWASFDIPAGTTRMRPVLSALERSNGDTVQFDRVALMLGAPSDELQEPQWRNGTSRPEHPVWSKPVIEYQENDGTGWSEWKLLAGQNTLPPQYDLNTSQMFYVDHTIVPIYSRRYRVSTMSYGLNGDVFSSGNGPASQEAVFESRAWWLKDIQDLSKNMQITVRWKDQQVDTTNMATAFQPIGEDFPVVITEGFKGDMFSLEIHCESSEFTALMDLLNSGRTLILQSDIDRMWWVRPVGNISSNILATSSRQERPRRYVTVSFAQVAPED